MGSLDKMPPMSPFSHVDFREEMRELTLPELPEDFECIFAHRFTSFSLHTWGLAIGGPVVMSTTGILDISRSQHLL